jgi:hypothetical protein
MIGAAAAGGAIAAAAFGIAALLASREAGDGPRDARLGQAEQQLRELAARPLPVAGDARRLDDLAGRVGRLEAALAAPRPAPADPALANRVSTLEGELAALRENVSILGRRSDEVATLAGEARRRADAAATTLAELAQKVPRPGPPAVERSELDALTNRVAAVERAAGSVAAALAARRPAEGGDHVARLAVAAAALAAAVERGDPFTAELAAVKALAPDAKPLAALEPFAASGVPAAAALARELSALVPALDAAAGGPPRDGGFLGRLQANAERLVRIRPLDEAPGGDPAAIVARAEVKAGRGDVAGALSELSQLPADLRVAAEPWIGKAQARAAAIETSRRLAADAFSELGKR